MGVKKPYGVFFTASIMDQKSVNNFLAHKNVENPGT
jgi:hypothetical protein